MKRILLLIPALNAGGAERVMVTLANEWSKENNVTILIFHNTDSFYDLKPEVKLVKMGLSLPSVGIKRIFSIPLIEIKRYNYIKKYVKTGHFDFVLSFTNITNIFTCLLSKRLKNSYFIISERADPKDYSVLMKLVINRLYRKCDMLICQNRVVMDFFRKKGFNNRLTILPNPVNFDDIPSERDTQRQKVITTVGRLTNQKNHKLLIDAFSIIHSIYPEYKLKIYGIGPLEEELKSQIRKLGLDEYVELMGIRKKVMHEINKSEIFVLCSDYEGFPNVLIEAMATQMPVISSDFATGVASELIKNGSNGYVFEVGDKEGLINALKSLIMRSDEFEKIGSINRKIAIKYKDENVAIQWMNEIENGLANSILE